MPQLTIYLRPTEKDALILLANQERRKLHEQAALIIRCELEHKGMLEPLFSSGISNNTIVKEGTNVGSNHS